MALNSVSFNLNRGTMLSIMGPSGCGKSTLLNLIGALDRPSAGEILIKGKNLKDYHPMHNFRARYIGFVFQFHHLLPHLTLMENVEMPMYALSVSRKHRREKARALLDEMGLTHRMNFFPNCVSGGERQRSAVARAFANDPLIVLADEPTGNLAKVSGEKTAQSMIDLGSKLNTTIITATHNREIASMADRITYLRNGEIENRVGWKCVVENAPA